MTREISCGVFLLSMLLPYLSSAATTDFLPVGGYLTDVESGEPLEGTFDMVFRLYDGRGAKTAIWEEAYSGKDAVKISGGLFSVYLGTIIPLDTWVLVDAASLWLGIQIDNDVEMSRIEIGAVPFSLEAEVCHEVADAFCGENAFLRGWKDGNAECGESSFQPALTRTITVSPVGDGGDAKANGDRLQAAVAGISDASESRPYLVRVEPGTYLLETEVGEAAGLKMKSWVDVAGAGRDLTVIQSRGSTEVPYQGNATVVPADHSALRDLTVFNNGEDASAVAIYMGIDAGATARLDNVRLRVQGAGECRGVNTVSVNLQVDNSLIEIDCDNYAWGMFVSKSNVTVRNTEITVNTGSASARMSAGMRINSGEVSVKAVSIVSTASGGGKAVGLYAQNEEQIPARLLVMDTTLSSSSISELSTPLYTLVGHLTGGHQITMQNCSLDASGTGEVVGLRTLKETHNDVNTGDASPTRVELFQSQVSSKGTLARITDDSENLFLHSLLKGGDMDVSLGTVRCSACTDENYVFFTNECP